MGKTFFRIFIHINRSHLQSHNIKSSKTITSNIGKYEIIRHNNNYTVQDTIPD